NATRPVSARLVGWADDHLAGSSSQGPVDAKRGREAAPGHGVARSQGEREVRRVRADPYEYGAATPHRSQTRPAQGAAAGHGWDGPMGHMIHGNPTFLPWHRELLRRLELDLQAIDSSVTIPYWDWTVGPTPTSPL